VCPPARGVAAACRRVLHAPSPVLSRIVYEVAFARIVAGSAKRILAGSAKRIAYYCTGWYCRPRSGAFAGACPNVETRRRSGGSGTAIRLADPMTLSRYSRYALCLMVPITGSIWPIQDRSIQASFDAASSELP
jgi:hypothetical protein